MAVGVGVKVALGVGVNVAVAVGVNVAVAVGVNVGVEVGVGDWQGTPGTPGIASISVRRGEIPAAVPATLWPCQIEPEGAV